MEKDGGTEGWKDGGMGGWGDVKKEKANEKMKKRTCLLCETDPANHPTDHSSEASTGGMGFLLKFKCAVKMQRKTQGYLHPLSCIGLFLFVVFAWAIKMGVCL